jgi:ferric-chelate reductase
MIVVLKTDIKGGIGARLRDLASAKTPVLLDGPYGAGADLTRHDTAILLAGGTGVSFIAGILQDLCQRYQSGQTCTRKIILHWVVRQEGKLRGFENGFVSIAKHEVTF